MNDDDVKAFWRKLLDPKNKAKLDHLLALGKRIREQRVADIKGRPYHWELMPEEGGTWFGRIVEFPDCITSGAKNAVDAVRQLDDIMTKRIEAMLKEKAPIPEPEPRRPER